MPVETGSTPENLTRREALKRGALFGGALLWTTPAVQAIGMSRAFAAEPSGPCATYCIKFNFNETASADDLSGSWVPLGGDNPGNCLACPPDAVNNTGIPAGFFDGFEIVGGSKTTSVTIRFPNTCSLAETDSSPDDLAPGSVVAKCGSGAGSCSVQSPAQVPGPNGTTEITVQACLNGKGISHIELLIRCCG